MSDLSQYDENYIRKREQDLAGHSAQIGRLCTLWSGLELDIAHCLIAVSYLDDPTNKNVLMGALNMRAKTSALLAIAYKRKPADEWYEKLSATLNTIGNELRVERNGMVHDFWMSIPDSDGVETLHRMKLEAKVKKQPGSGERKLFLAEYKPVTPKEISDLCEKIIAANITLNGLRREFELSPLSGKLAQPVPPRNQIPD